VTEASSGPEADSESEHRSIATRVRSGRERLGFFRRRWPALDAAFETYERDRDVNGNIFAGAVAFRLFLWLLPLTLVLVVLLAFIVSSGGEVTETVKAFGISNESAIEIAKNLSRSDSSRWWLLALGLFALYGASIAVAKVVHRAHALAWGSSESRLRSHPKVAGLVLAIAGLVLAVTGIAARVRALSGAGWFLRIGLLALYAGVWIVVSWVLPHRDAPVVRLLPGAIAFALGVVALHLLTVTYFVHKLDSASELYGGLGTAFVLLLWLYLVARLVVASAVVNATLYDRSLREGSAGGD
jgi:uncharacterized BrkB/YihY/UPF0761 family membrane protein